MRPGKKKKKLVVRQTPTPQFYTFKCERHGWYPTSNLIILIGCFSSNFYFLKI